MVEILRNWGGGGAKTFWGQRVAGAAKTTNIQAWLTSRRSILVKYILK